MLKELQCPGLTVSMHSVWRESGQTHGDVIGTLRIWRAVLHPLARPSVDGLTSSNINDSIVMCHAKQTVKHHGVLVELWRLSRLKPTARTVHVSDTESIVA